MSRTRNVAFILTTLTLLVLADARPALACSVCGAGDGPTQSAFMLVTIVLSLSPLVFAGSVIWWLRRRAKQIEKEQSFGLQT